MTISLGQSAAMCSSALMEICCSSSFAPFHDGQLQTASVERWWQCLKQTQPCRKPFPFRGSQESRNRGINNGRLQRQSTRHHQNQYLVFASANARSSKDAASGNGAADHGKGESLIGEKESATARNGDSQKGTASAAKLLPAENLQGEGPHKSPSEVKRAGLFRTPISGGVQSATSVHKLPAPAIAVRNLTEQARFAHLCTIMSRMHHRRRGYPFGSLVDFATDQDGHPIFSLSPLAIHTRNLLADPRCTLVVQIPGWSGLANARVTLFGDVYPLPREQQEWAQKIYQTKHHHGASQQWGNFYFYRMDSISDIYFVGGFGTVAWVDIKEYVSAQPDRIAADNAEQTLQELNGKFSRQLKKLLAAACEAKTGGKVSVDDAALISIDSKGVDIRVRQGAQFNVQRMSFEAGQTVNTLDQAVIAFQCLLDNGIKEM